MSGFFRQLLLLLGCLILASCGSSNGGGRPVIGPSAPPANPPPSPPTSNFNTVEFRNNYGLGQINAIAAYEDGATGAGITVAVIDSGIDIDHAQIEANIHVDSTNIVTGNKADLNDIDGHGTGVAGVIAAIRDPANNSNANTHGVAFDSQIMAINAASIGSCADIEEGCSFFDRDVAAALDYARVRGVKVVNISLGGDGFNSFALVEAYRRAVDAGMVIIIAAGNREEEDTDITIARPENSASVAWASWANGQIIVAGAVGQSSIIGDFSHRAGSVAKDVFLVAAGERIPSLGANGDFFFWTGTSFSAPHISGAAALLFQAFPNLTGQEVAELLFTTATDLGAAGNDIIYGAGLINLEEAFRPQGTSSIAIRSGNGTVRKVPLQDSILLGGEAFGGMSGFSAAFEDSLLLDGYDRSFRTDLGQQIFDPGRVVELQSFIGSRRGYRTSSLPFSATANLRLSWNEDWQFEEVDENYFSHQHKSRNRNRNLRMKLGLTLGKGQELTITQGHSLKESLEDYDGHEFLTIGKQGFTTLVGREDGQSLIYGQPLTVRTRLTLAAGHGERQWQQYGLKANSYAAIARLDYNLSSVMDAAIDFGLINEKGSVLGSLSDGAVSLGSGATTIYAAVKFDWNITGAINFFAHGSYGKTAVRAADLSLVEQIDDLTSGSFSIGLTGHSLFQKGDRLSFAVSQPLRVIGGRANIAFSDARDYQNDRFSFISRQVSLAPKGREIDFELAYRLGAVLGANVDINLLHQINPNHNHLNPDNTGFLIRFGSDF